MFNDLPKTKEENSKLKQYDGFIYASDSKEYYNQGKLIKVFVDEEDFMTYKKYGWYISRKGYVYTMINNHTIFLHRLITNCTNPSLVVDHHDGNKLNNTRLNLKVMTNEENLEKAWYEQSLYQTNKAVVMFLSDDMDYCNPIKEFSSQREAQRYLCENGYSASQGSISNACSGRAKTCCGFRWRYKNEANG